MAITFDLPASIERQLRSESADFDAVAKEAALVELYRQSKLTHHQLAVEMGLERMAVDEMLKRHQVTEDLVSADALNVQLAHLRQFVNE